MEVLLIIAGVILLIIGVIGCFAPVIPGPLVAYCAILLRHLFSNKVSFSNELLIILAVVMVVISIIDYFLPGWFTKKAGGSKYSSRGALIGTFAGIIFTPIGMLLGMFLGALIGQMMHESDISKAFNVACYSFLGFFFSSGMKVIYCFVVAYFFFFP